MASEREPLTVVITGASAGVGRATARKFAASGANIALLARGDEGMDGLEGAKRDVESLGGKALIIPADMADYEQVEAAAETIDRVFGNVDVWINNAMLSVFSPFKEMTNDEFYRVTEVTYLGYVYGTMVALKRMRPRNRGRIIQVGSALAYRSIPLQSAYCGAKHGIRGFTDSVRTELLHDKSDIKITMVQMPALNTPQFSWTRTRMPHKPQPVPPIFQPELAAEAIYWSAYNYRRELNVGISTVIAILANKFAPTVADLYLAATGYKSQQYDGPVEPGRRDNLFAPVSGDHGAHGDFDDRSMGWCLQLWLTMNRKLVFSAAACIAAALLIKHKLDED
jgi:short-subunit dehydrogenase